MNTEHWGDKFVTAANEYGPFSGNFDLARFVAMFFTVVDSVASLRGSVDDVALHFTVADGTSRSLENTSTQNTKYRLRLMCANLAVVASQYCGCPQHIYGGHWEFVYPLPDGRSLNVHLDTMNTPSAQHFHIRKVPPGTANGTNWSLYND